MNIFVSDVLSPSSHQHLRELTRSRLTVLGMLRVARPVRIHTCRTVSNTRDKMKVCILTCLVPKIKPQTDSSRGCYLSRSSSEADMLLHTFPKFLEN